MLRIGGRSTGIDLTAQNQLSRTLSQLAQTSTRLSTLQQINRGSDDPAGMIAVEALRSELISLEKASQSADRARSLVRVADSSLSQTSALFNRIRGNVLAAASSTTSAAERDALQLEIDAALEAIDRIGRTASLGGRKLLDGSAGFETSGVNVQQVANIEVFQRSGGNSTAVDIEVLEAAAAAQLSVDLGAGALADDTALLVRGSDGTTTLNLSAGATVDDVAAAVNSNTSDTGVAAQVDNGELTLVSVDVGSGATIDVEVLEGSLDVGDGSAGGSDVRARVNGSEVVGDGNEVRVNIDSLEAEIAFVVGFVGQADPITVQGSALTILVGPGPNDLAALALPNVNSSTLGGAAGRLNQLASGGSVSLASGNLAQAFEIIDAAQGQLLRARARAGAFELHTIDSTQRVIDESIVNISRSISEIADADVALESANLVRSLIMTDSGINSVLLAGSRHTAAAQLLGSTLDRSA